MQKRKGKNAQDPSAPLDPNSMTLNDLIWQAHTHATAKEQEYQKALAEKKEREAADAEKKKQQAQNTEVENLPAAPIEPVPDAPSTSFAPRLVMRNGQIAVDEQSLTIQVLPPAPSFFCFGVASWACCKLQAYICRLKRVEYDTLPATAVLCMQAQRTTALPREVEEDDGEMLINSHSYLPLSKLTKELSLIHI